MTPSFVDKYYGSVSDAVPETHSTDDLSISIPKPSSYMNGVGGAEKDSDTSGRGDFAHTVTVTLADVAVDKDEFGKYNIAAGSAGTLRVQCSIKVSESIFGLPTVEIKELVVGSSTYLKLRQMSLHSSQYAKLSSRNI